MARDELGVFKAEMASFFQAMALVSPLKNKDVYLKKGERRQRSLIFHQAFPFALKLGLLTQQFTPAEVLFWMKEYERFTQPTAPA